MEIDSRPSDALQDFPLARSLKKRGAQVLPLRSEELPKSIENEILTLTRAWSGNKSIGTLGFLNQIAPLYLKEHKKLFALLRFIAENSEVYNTERKVLTVLKILTGHVEFIADPRTGELVAQPDSISFESMDQIEFSEWYEKAVSAACQHLVKHMTRMDLEQALDMVAAW